MPALRAHAGATFHPRHCSRRYERACCWASCCVVRPPFLIDTVMRLRDLALWEDASTEWGLLLHDAVARIFCSLERFVCSVGGVLTPGVVLIASAGESESSASCCRDASIFIEFLQGVYPVLRDGGVLQNFDTSELRIFVLLMSLILTFLFRCINTTTSSIMYKFNSIDVKHPASSETIGSCDRVTCERRLFRPIVNPQCSVVSQSAGRMSL